MHLEISMDLPMRSGKSMDSLKHWDLPMPMGSPMEIQTHLGLHSGLPMHLVTPMQMEISMLKGSNWDLLKPMAIPMVKLKRSVKLKQMEISMHLD